MLSLRLLWIPVCLLAAAAPAAAQEDLTMADVTGRALAKNHAIRIEREGITAADARMTEALGQYDAQVRFDLTARHSRDPITSLFSGAPSGEVAPTANSFGSNLSVSQLFKSGAVASAWTSASREGTNSAFSWSHPAYFTTLGVDLRQPLLRNRAIDPARAALRVTALDRDRSGAALERQVLERQPHARRTISRLELILGKILPFLLIGYIQTALMVVLMEQLFAVHVQGSVGALFLLTGLYIAGVLGLGMLISTIAQTQMQASSMSMMLAMPFVFLSGYVFPIGGMPLIFQWLTKLIPANDAIQILRGIVLRGATMHDLREPIFWLSLYTVGIIGLAMMRFKKTAE